MSTKNKESNGKEREDIRSQYVEQSLHGSTPKTHRKKMPDAVTHSAPISAGAAIAASRTNTIRAGYNSEITAHRAGIFQTCSHTRDIETALCRLYRETAARGIKYRRNPVPSRAGYMVENVMAESLNLDAVIHKSPVRAVVPDSNRAGSPDIIVTDGNGKEIPFSSKFHETALKSAMAQTDPRLDGQRKLIPQDQLKEGRILLEKRAHKKELCGRPDAALRQRAAADALSDGIAIDGVESMRPTRQNAHDLAKAVTVGENGEAVVDREKIKAVLKDTGVLAKAEKAVNRNTADVERKKCTIKKLQSARAWGEIKGAAAAAGMAALTNAGTTVAATLIRQGVSGETLKTAMINGLQSGVEGGVISLGVYGITRTAGASLYHAAAIRFADAGVQLGANIADGVCVGIMGAVATAAVSAYTFVKIKKQGATTGEALRIAGKNAAVSMGVTAAAGITTLAFGAFAGAALSAAISIGMIAFGIVQNVWGRNEKNVENINRENGLCHNCKNVVQNCKILNVMPA